MSEKQATCPHCGKTVAAALLGLCPECMLKAGMATVTAEPSDRPQTGRFVPPSVQELSAQFPGLEIIELIGRGGMGAVYKARQKQLDRVVALKILPPEVGDDPAFAGRFAREAKALAQLSHPNIVAMYEFGETGARISQSPGIPATSAPLSADDGRASIFYFLMEYVDGLNLRQLLAGGKLPPKEALAIVPQICDALQYAHDRGIVHRDIKPENILLSRDGVVKIADFGVAKIVGKSEDRETGSEDSWPEVTGAKVLGTPAYMAPEQKDRPADVDHRADIYSLGVVFYQMLTGELPAKHIEPPSRKVQIDVRIDEIVMRALERNPNMRYSQASVFKTEVETVASTSGSPLQPFPPTTQSETTKTTPEKTTQAHWVWVKAGFFFFTAACALVNAVYQANQENGILSLLWIFGGVGFGLSAFRYARSAQRLAGATGTPQAAGIRTKVETIAAAKAQPGTAAMPAQQKADLSDVPTLPAARFSKVAIVGMIWAILGLLAILAIGNISASVPCVILVILTVAAGTTLLGGIATRQIRRSAGQVSGLKLAVTARLFFPLLALDGLIALGWYWLVRWLWPESSSQDLPSAFDAIRNTTIITTALVVVSVIAVDSLIIRKVWRSANSPLNGQQQSPTPAVEKLRLGIMRQAVLVLVGGILLCAVAFAVWRMVYQVPASLPHSGWYIRYVPPDPWLAKSNSRPIPTVTTPVQADWVAHLPSGISVELLGASENPSLGRPWWRPDGSPMVVRPYDYLFSTVTPRKDEFAREFAVRIDPLPKQPLDTEWTFAPSGSSAGGGPPMKVADPVPNLRAIAEIVPADRAAITIRFGVAAGPWQTVGESSGRGSDSMSVKQSILLFSPATGENGAVVISVTHNLLDQAVRLIAVKTDGAEITPSTNTGGAGGISQMTGRFSALTITEVKMFRLQTRPYEWAEFRNVAVNPQKIREMAEQPNASPQPATMTASQTVGSAIDLPFQDDPQVIGQWASVDFVPSIPAFDPDRPTWSGAIPFKGLDFQEGGRMSQPWWTWTKGVVIHHGDKTASRYEIRKIKGESYLFFERNSGDVTIRGMKPQYYVLKKMSGSATVPSPAGQAAEPSADEKTRAQAAHLKLQFAETRLKRGEALYRDGRSRGNEYGRAQFERDAAAAELKGDTAEVLRLKARFAKQNFERVDALFNAGKGDIRQLLQAQLDRDIAAAELKGDVAEAAHLQREFARHNFDLIQDLYKAGAVTADEYEKAKFARDLADIGRPATLPVRK